MAFPHGSGTFLVLRPTSLPGPKRYGGPSAGAATELVRSGSLQACFWKAHAGGSRRPGDQQAGKAALRSAAKRLQILFFFPRIFLILPLPKPQKTFPTSVPCQVN